MAAKKVEKKRKSKRKSRTEVSDISSDSDASATHPKRKEKIQTAKPAPAGTEDDVLMADETEAEAALPPPPKKATLDPEQAFQDFYLKQATMEFANDLDKLRSAGDFKDSSVGILISALKHGTACFSQEERVRVGGAGTGARVES